MTGQFKFVFRRLCITIKALGVYCGMMNNCETLIRASLKEKKIFEALIEFYWDCNSSALSYMFPRQRKNLCVHFGELVCDFQHVVIEMRLV